MTVPATPGPDPAITRIRLRIDYSNGAWREYEAHHPCDPQIFIAADETPAGPGPGLDGGPRREPRIGIAFSGNPEAGGIRVDQAGVL